ncbi:MAG: hypothetical protein EBZ49_04850 [Proteobacteria bacterium]|nr:hypothetical protein [Pseudomonadota bacterium]
MRTILFFHTGNPHSLLFNQLEKKGYGIMEFLVGAKAQLKLDVITKGEQGKIPRKQARQILGKSERALER